MPVTEDSGLPGPSSRPIGVFDSGVGGLSVLRALWNELPHENYVYVADSGHAPYGEKDDRLVLERAHAITRQLLGDHDIKALVVACNTATAAAIAQLRADYPDMPIVGIEPAVKPAVAHSRTGVVGVMATRGTLKSEKFRALMASLPGSNGLVLQACDGLANAIECNDATKTEALCATYTRAIGHFGTQPGQCDTLVLGCTHYPFAEATLRKLCGPEIILLEGGTPVARRTKRLLDEKQLGRPVSHGAGQTHFRTTGDDKALADAVGRWLDTTLDSDGSAVNKTTAESR